MPLPLEPIPFASQLPVGEMPSCHLPDAEPSALIAAVQELAAEVRAMRAELKERLPVVGVRESGIWVASAGALPGEEQT